MIPVHSTKISEKIFFDDDKMIVKKTHDASHMLEDAKFARENSPNAFGSDYKLVGHVDAALVSVWLKEAGVSWDDTQAVKDIIKRKMMSNEFSALRVWNGSY